MLGKLGVRRERQLGNAAGAFARSRFLYDTVQLQTGYIPRKEWDAGNCSGQTLEDLSREQVPRSHLSKRRQCVYLLTEPQKATTSRLLAAIDHPLTQTSNTNNPFFFFFFFLEKEQAWWKPLCEAIVRLTCTFRALCG